MGLLERLRIRKGLTPDDSADEAEKAIGFIEAAEKADSFVSALEPLKQFAELVQGSKQREVYDLGTIQDILADHILADVNRKALLGLSNSHNHSLSSAASALEDSVSQTIFYLREAGNGLINEPELKRISLEKAYKGQMESLARTALAIGNRVIVSEEDLERVIKTYEDVLTRYQVNVGEIQQPVIKVKINGEEKEFTTSRVIYGAAITTNLKKVDMLLSGLPSEVVTDNSLRTYAELTKGFVYFVEQADLSMEDQIKLTTILDSLKEKVEAKTSEGKEVVEKTQDRIYRTFEIFCDDYAAGKVDSARAKDIALTTLKKLSAFTNRYSIVLEETGDHDYQDGLLKMEHCGLLQE